MKKWMFLMAFGWLCTLSLGSSPAFARAKVKCTSLAKWSCYKRCARYFIGEKQKRCSKLHFGIWRCSHQATRCRVMSIRKKKGAAGLAYCKTRQEKCVQAFFARVQKCLKSAAVQMTSGCWSKCRDKQTRVCTHKTCTPCK